MRLTATFLLGLLAVVGCGRPDPLALRPGDTIVPVVHLGSEWTPIGGGVIAVAVSAEGGGRPGPTTIPADQLPAGSTVAAEVRFAGPDGKPVGPVLRPEFAPDC